VKKRKTVFFIRYWEMAKGQLVKGEQTGDGSVNQQTRHDKIKQPIILAKRLSKDIPAQTPAGGGNKTDQCQDQCKQSDHYRSMVGMHNEQ
jgi:hypothetical protein